MTAARTKVRHRWAVFWAVFIPACAGVAFGTYQLPSWFPEVQGASWWLFLTPETWDKSPVTKEWGLWENVTALAFFASFLLLIRGFLRSRGAPPLARYTPLAWGFVLLLVAGEEVSWGQHLLGFGTPRVIEASNLQEEMNLHNLLAHGTNYAAVIVVFLLYVGAFPIGRALVPRVRRLAHSLNLPCPPLVMALPCTAVFILCCADVVLGKSDLRWFGLREIREFMLGLVVFAATLDWSLGSSWQRARPPEPA
jgi:hypothetical protein